MAFDPEGTGPDTHYKVLQVIAEALRLAGLSYKHISLHFVSSFVFFSVLGDSFNPMIWGYRNVWHRFRFAERVRQDRSAHLLRCVRKGRSRGRTRLYR